MWLFIASLTDPSELWWIVFSLLIAIVTAGNGFLFYPAFVARANGLELAPPLDRVLRGDEKGKPVLSLVIPAYNEEERLPAMLKDAHEYLSKNQCKALQVLGGKADREISVEWIVVDDGSRDRTSEVFEEFAATSKSHFMSWRLVRLPINRGKGAAVQAGMLASCGKFCLMVDADGATDFGNGLEALCAEMDTGDQYGAILIGSRAHIQNERSLTRRILSSAFRTLLAITLGGKAAGSLRDTQCGFKLFPEDAAKSIFNNLHLQRWGFDIEVLYLAVLLQFDLKEVVVPWQEIEGSKLHTSAFNLAWVSASMFRDMLCVRLCYDLGIWSLKPKKT